MTKNSPEKMRELVSALKNLQSTNNYQRNAAENAIVAAAAADFFRFVIDILEIVREPSIPPITQITAGMVLKMFFSGESPEKKKEVGMRWAALAESQRGAVKREVVELLASPHPRVGLAIAQCVSSIAKVELSTGAWQEVFKELSDIAASSADINRKRAAIEAIGLLCADPEGIDDSLICSSSGHILTAIISGMGHESLEIKKTAAESLKQCMEFISYNMEIENERLAIMEVLYNACKAEDAELSSAALNCVIRAVDLYYDKMAEYIRMAFADLSLEFLRSNDEQRVFAALEFWSTVADVEKDLEYGAGSHAIVADGFQVAVPGILAHLQKTEDLEEPEDWTPMKAAACALSLIGLCSKDLIGRRELLFKRPGLGESRGTLVEYVQDAIEDPGIVRAESGMMMLGCLLNDKTSPVLAKPIKREMARIIGLLGSEVATVQDTALWLIGKIFTHAAEAVDEDDDGHKIMIKILDILKKCDAVSVNAAWTLTNVFASVSARRVGDRVEESLLTTYFTEVASLLVALIASLKPTDFNLRTAMFSALNEVIKISVNQNQAFVLSIAEDAISKIKLLLEEKDVEMAAAEEMVCCNLGVIQECIRSARTSSLDRAMEIVRVCAYLLGNPNYVPVFTDAYLTLSCLADAIGLNFGNFDTPVLSFVERDLGLLASGSVAGDPVSAMFAASLITFVGSMASALQLGFGPCVQRFMPLLLDSLGAPCLPREAKPAIVSAFADISLAVGKMFDPYIETMFSICVSIMSLADVDEDYLLALREALLDLFSCIVQSSNGKNELVNSSIPALIEAVHRIAVETDDSACVIKSLELLSDIAIMYGNRNEANMSGLQSTWVLEFITAKAASTNAQVREAANNARFHINTLENNF